jgi:3-hydroxyisobutyrate dehydrogenase
MELALIGTGLMGIPLGQRLLEAGMALTVYNRTQEKTEPLQAAGARVADSVAAALERAEVIILMLSDFQAIQDNLLSAAARHHLAGRTVIQMGTIAPQESQALQEAIAEEGGDYLETPVLGSIPEATAGTLIVMVGGTPEQFQRWLPVLRCFGPEPRLIGPVGHAATLKLALNQLIAALTASFALSLGLVQRQGVEVEAFMEILRKSALYAPTFDKKRSRMQERNYANPNFPTKHLLKDVNLFLSTAAAAGLDARTLTGVQHLIENTMAQGLGESDYSALFNAISPEEP